MVRDGKQERRIRFISREALWRAAVIRRFSGKLLPRHIVKTITQAVRTAPQETNFFARLRIHIDKFPSCQTASTNSFRLTYSRRRRSRVIRWRSFLTLAD